MKTLLVFIISLVLVACSVNDPIHTQQVVDDRPTITFDVQNYNANELTLTIDGLSYGSVAKYLNDSAALRIIPGRHRITVTFSGRAVFEKSDFFGESSHTELRVN